MILITGATGKTGGEVARKLAAANIPFKALVRDAEKAADIAALGAELVVGDVADREFLSMALSGVDKAFLVLPNNEEQLTLENQFTDACAEAGVKHIVYLSSLESVPENTNPITQNHVNAENHIRESGMQWTMIRPTFFMQNFDTSAARIKEISKIIMPCGQGAVSTTDLRDVADVIVKVLTEPGHEGKSYDLTGSELLNFHEIAGKFSEVLGKEVEYIDQPLDEFAQILQSIGFSEWRVDAVCKELSGIAGGSVDHTTGTIQELLGRPPATIEQYIRDHREMFGG